MKTNAFILSQGLLNPNATKTSKEKLFLYSIIIECSTPNSLFIDRNVL